MQPSIRRGLLLAASAATLTIFSTSEVSAAPAAPAADNPGSQIETVVVTGVRYREKALQQKQAAPNVVEIQPVQEIRKLPDVNVAEALQRIPGISMESDTGEGRFINIRGMDADLNGTTYDGVHMTASNQSTPQGGARAVAFDAFPSGAIGGVEVIKTITPDMDAEGLGGVVNLQPRSLPADGESFLDAGLGSGYEPQRERPVWQGDITGGTTFDSAGNIGDGGPFGIIGTYGYEEDHRGIDDVEEDYLTEPPSKLFDDLQMRWYEYHRTRQGGGGGFTWNVDDFTTLFLRGIHAGYTEHAEKHRLELDGLGDGSNLQTAEQTFTDSDEDVGNDLIEFGGHTAFPSGITADYRGAWTRGHDDFGRSWSGGFATPYTTITYNNTDASHPTWHSALDLTNPANFFFADDLNNSPSSTFDEEWSGNADFQMPLPLGDFDGKLKFGSAVRLRSRGVTASEIDYSMNNPVSLSGLTEGSDIIYYNDFYNIGPNLNAQAIEGLPGLIGTVNTQTALGSFERDSEDVYATYIEYVGTIGRFGVLGGVRAERTVGTFNANLATTDASGNVSYTPNTNKTEYLDFFPSLQAKYHVDDDSLVRAAFSTAIARPGFNQITAAESIDKSNLPDITISKGNPSLKPTLGDSFDLTYERYLPNGGIAYAGLFYKYFSDYIVPTETITPNKSGMGNTILDSFSNIGPAFAEGFEMNYVQQFTFLPQPMDGFGVDGNMTINYTRGDIRAGERHALPQTSPYNFNAELFYEKGPIGIRLAASYVSSNIFAVGSDQYSDIYSQPRFRLDLGSTYDLTDNVQFYFNVKNLTNTLLEFTESKSTNFPIQREFYGPTYFAGVRVQIGQGGFAHMSTGGDDD